VSGTNQIVWEGLTELRAALRELPANLATEASGIVNDAAEGAKAEILAAYQAHRRSGDLAAHLTLGRGRAIGRFSASTILKNNAKHAWMFENGSQARHHKLGGSTGSMPAAHIFIPTVMRHRRAMYARLAALLEYHGLSVTGDAAA